MQSSSYTITFACILSLVSSVLLSGVFMLLKDKQDENKKLDRQINILKAAQINPKDMLEAKQMYEKFVTPLIIDENGQEHELSKEDKKGLSIYAIKDEQNQIIAYVYPIEGKGLWSSLYGYLAVDNKGINIKGITFYQQGETPGLGAEIEKDWFRDNFIGKSLHRENAFFGVKVAKGLAVLDKEYKSYPQNLVNGISGATITGDGVSEMLKRIPKNYENFFSKKRTE